MDFNKLLITITTLFMLAFISCSNDKSGDYKLIDIDLSSTTISNHDYEKGLAEALGSIWSVEKIGDRYKITMDGERDALIFTPDGEQYSAHNGKLRLTFTSKGAILIGTDADKTATWTLQKIN